ncbi:MAG: hypothetical protein M1834_000800 [Cirrosporium novae-zelandiae]|nr:MAG: hypothetical protein M1834_000800 [Cirrosporium novae-zelandiae]
MIAEAGCIDIACPLLEVQNIPSPLVLSSLKDDSAVGSTPPFIMGTYIETFTEAKTTVSATTQQQNVLLLHGPKQRYSLTTGYQIPDVQSDDEMLVKVHIIGLNPIDWKSAEFGFGLPSLPCIAGRDFAGTIVQSPETPSRFRHGDPIVAISTDYRDFRKSAFQEYSITTTYNSFRLPPSLPAKQGASLGVAFVAAALALGICIGVDFSSEAVNRGGDDLLSLTKSLERESLPQDIRAECFEGINEAERPRPGDWIAIWGASSATGFMALQLAKRCGLGVICIAGVTKHGKRLRNHGADVLIDRYDDNKEMIVEKIRSAAGGRLKFGLDTVGKDTAGLLQKAMIPTNGNDSIRSHLVGLAGLPYPDSSTEHIKHHSVPIKLFHESPLVGTSLMIWVEQLLESGDLVPPMIVDVKVAPGLEGVNDGLKLLRTGKLGGGRIIVPLVETGI